MPRIDPETLFTLCGPFLGPIGLLLYLAVRAATRRMVVIDR